MIAAPRNAVAIVLTVCVFISPLAASSVGSDLHEDLVAALRSKHTDDLFRVLNQIKASSYKGDVLPLLVDIWSGNDTDHDLPVAFLGMDIVRISVGDVLVQAHINGLVQIELGEFQSYARGRLSSSDVEIVSRAATLLSQIDDPIDVPVLRELATGSSGYVFNSAVAALVLMCNGDAESALSRLLRQTDDTEKRSYIVDSQMRFKALKSTRGFCRTRAPPQ